MKEIPLTQGKVTLVDDEDYEYLNQFNWYAVRCKRKGGETRTFYALRSDYGNRRQIPMHRDIMKTLKGMEVDHKDGDGLNNQRYNLRNCTRLQNVLNQRTHQHGKTSRYRGVLWNGKRKWRVQIQYKHTVYYLGYFEKEKEAALAWDIKAKELFGEFARLNLPKYIHKIGVSHAKTN